jgi:Tfp pilus assembly protein PilO
MKFRRFYLWIALPVVIIIAWVVFFYWPLAKETRLRKQEMAATIKEIEGADSELTATGTLLEKERQIKQSLTELYNRIPHLAELPDLMRWMVKKAKQDGLALEVVQGNVSALQGTGNSGVVHPVFEVRVKGRFLDVGRFLGDLETRALFKGVTSARIAGDDRDNPIVLAKCALELNAWRERFVEGK